MDKPLPPPMDAPVAELHQEDISDHIGIRSTIHDSYHAAPLEDCPEPPCAELRQLGDERKARKAAGTWTKISRHGADVRQVT